MPDITIPPVAVEAAAIALYAEAINADIYGDGWPKWDSDDNLSRQAFFDEATHALTAAAPYIAAQALRDAADDDFTTATHVRRVGYLRLRDRADRIEADHG